MSLFSFRRPKDSAPGRGSLPPLGESEAVALAGEAKNKGDWGTVLVTLDRLKAKKDAGVDCHLLRGWALQRAGRLEEADAAVRKALQLNPDISGKALLDEIKGRRKARNTANPQGRQWARVKVEGSHFGMEPADALALTQVVLDLKPRAILELGSLGGGVANWLATLTAGMGIETQVHSADWEARAKGTAAKVKFYSGDLRKPSSFWPGQVLNNLPHPCLVLLRSQGGYEVTWPALRAMHKYLREGDVICVVTEPDGERTSAQALVRFAGSHPVDYGTLGTFEASFGVDGPATALSCLRHTGLDPLDVAASPGLDAIRGRMARGEWKLALEELNALKATRQPKRGVDYLRALCFLELKEALSVCESAKEELRYFPDHPHAKAMLEAMLRQLFPGTPALGGREFHELYRVVRPYTMLSDERLYSIYLRVRLVCQMDLPGDVVECGVAAGGASAMMAAVVARHSRRPRKVFSCDTFEGMPTPDERDKHDATGAEASGWGSGTCAAPPGSLLEVAAKLGVTEIVQPVKGLFKDTLGGLRGQLNEGIAFLHMDGDWYESTMDILQHLYTAVQARGFIQVDDYGHWEGCRQAMTDYAKQHGFAFDVHVIDATGVWLQRPDRPASDLMLLNLGCGMHFHQAWVNLDIAPANDQVIQHNLAEEPLPFENRSCAAVYHSHVLEHIPPQQVRAFIDECFRVLAFNGILRIAVPDLEGIARQYLTQLDAAAAGDEAAVNRHEWMTIEMVDQLTRETSGGHMLEYWKQNPMPAEDFVFERVGWEARRFVEQWRKDPASISVTPARTPEEVGRFRAGGEVHKWMWDRISLTRLLVSAGFVDVQVCKATESGILGFASYELDADADGQTRKPDSLFIEALRPSA